jgi:hypothetical protein
MKLASGNALIVTLVTIATVVGFIALSINLTKGVSRNVERSAALRQAIDIGDATTEMAFANWRATFIKNFSKDALPSNTFTGTALPSPSPGNFPGAKYTLDKFSVVALDSTWTPLASVSATPPKTMGPNPQNYSYYYLASADVIIPTLTSKNPSSVSDAGNVVARVRRVIEKYRHNKTDKALDYRDDLEIHPGPTFVINGDVHTNGNLWTGHNSLTLNGTTTFGGAWKVDFMPGDSQHLNDTPVAPNWNVRPKQDQATMTYGVDSPNYHKLIEPVATATPAPPGTISTTDPLYPFSFSNAQNYAAKITITDNPDPTKPDIVKIYNTSGIEVTGATGTSADAQLAALFKSVVTTNQTITDNRQGATTGNNKIRVTTLDVGKITDALKSGSYPNVNLSASPVIYISDVNADPNDPTKQRAIRLSNGAILPSGGLTIASSNPVYVQGDYNTGRNGSNEPVSNITPDPTNAPTTNPASPTTLNYTRQPAAVVADAVTILSNAWSDANSAYSTAKNTTVNTAIIAGIVPSGNGYYSGGAENFPRFLENWSGKTLTYYGSMIELYASEQAIGHWGAANVYSPPNRAWYFDTNFLSHPPAGVPYDVDYRRGRWYVD